MARQARTRNETGDTMSTETETGVRSSRRGFSALNLANQMTFRLGDNSEVIVFLEEENFTYALRHWVKYIPGDSADNKPMTRVEYCLEDDCPLCDIGDRPKSTAFFNVVNLTVPNKVLVWEATADPTGAIEKEFKKLFKNGKHLSDDGLYWVISREKGKNGFYTYSVDRLTEEGLQDEWPSLSPLTPAQRVALRTRMYDESYVQVKTREELQEFVDSLG